MYPGKYSISSLGLLGPSPRAPQKGVKQRVAVEEPLITVLTGTSPKQPGTSWCPFRGRRELVIIGVWCTGSFPRVSSIIFHLIPHNNPVKERHGYSAQGNDLHAADGGGPLSNSNPCPVHSGLHPVKGLSAAEDNHMPSLPSSAQFMLLS